LESVKLAILDVYHFHVPEPTKQESISNDQKRSAVTEAANWLELIPRSLTKQDQTNQKAGQPPDSAAVQRAQV
jgi:hypothetical protein